MRSCSSVWNSGEVLPRPRMVSTIWVPATAQSFSVSCEAKTAVASWTRLTSTGARTSGVGDGVADGALDGVGDDGGDCRAVGGRIDERLDPRRPAVEPLAHAEHVGTHDGEAGDEEDDHRHG